MGERYKMYVQCLLVSLILFFRSEHSVKIIPHAHQDHIVLTLAGALVISVLDAILDIHSTTIFNAQAIIQPIPL